jgi:serine/threonine-protein kinase
VLGAVITLLIATVVVWIQATGTLSSYFMVAAAMLVVSNRALLTWSMGVVSVGAVLALHGGSFVLEELGVLSPAPLFRAGAGPVYQSPELRWSVIGSVSSVYVATWMGANVLIATMRRTERALASAQRRLAAAADFAREGRLTGKSLAGYALLELIGRGGMAEVYRAVPAARRGGDPVAVKVVHPFLVDDETIITRARREAALASRLPGTVTAAVREVHLAGPGERLVVLDYLDGEDLAALLRRRHHLPLDEAIALLVAICHAVHAVHGAGIVHRDLKPHNLFVLSDGSVRVLDFGVARADGDEALTRATALLGTPGYMAPEMLSGGAAAVGVEADVYALGVIAYQALTGQRPTPMVDPLVTPVAPPPPSHVVPGLPEDLDVVLALALAHSPTARYRSAADLAIDLERATTGTLPPEQRRRAATAGAMLADTLVAGQATP